MGCLDVWTVACCTCCGFGDMFCSLPCGIQVISASWWMAHLFYVGQTLYLCGKQTVGMRDLLWSYSVIFYLYTLPLALLSYALVFSFSSSVEFYISPVHYLSVFLFLDISWHLQLFLTLPDTCLTSDILLLSFCLCLNSCPFHFVSSCPTSCMFPWCLLFVFNFSFCNSPSDIMGTIPYL